MGLDEWRTRINEIDRQVLGLLNQRAGLAAEIGRAKREAGLPVHVPEREQEILDELLRLNDGPLPGEAVRAIWTEILSASRNLQRPFRVVYLGPTATFTHVAARRRFGASAEYVPVRGIPEVFAEVERGRADVGLVPVENTTEGAVNATLDCLVDFDLLICGEVRLEIRQCLLSHAREVAEVKQVFSHPQALAQCREWLNRHLPRAETVEVPSTAAAAEHAREEPTAAAIASELAARIYGLPILQDAIEDLGHNSTRFLVVGREAASATGRDKTSVLFSVKHEAGALHRALESFAVARVNLSRIESRPSRQRAWDYIFFVDFEGHRLDPVIQGVLAAVRERCLFLKVLGSYPTAS